MSSNYVASNYTASGYLVVPFLWIPVSGGRHFTVQNS